MTVIQMPIILDIVDFDRDFKNDFLYDVIPGAAVSNRGCPDYTDAQREMINPLHSKLHWSVTEVLQYTQSQDNVKKLKKEWPGTDVFYEQTTSLNFYNLLLNNATIL